MKKAVINKDRCDRSPFCPVKRICPVEAVTQNVKFFKGDTPVVDHEKCIGCGKCISVCPMKAVRMV